MYSPDRIRQTLAVKNLCAWINLSEEERRQMAEGKWCKLAHGFVRTDYDCCGCLMCENKTETDDLK